MLPVRVAFDPALPVVTTERFCAGGQSFAADQPFPWRELGLSEADLHALWRAAYVAFVPLATVGEDVAAGEKRAMRTDDGRTLIVTAGEKVHVPTPKQKRQRAAQRAPE